MSKEVKRYNLCTVDRYAADGTGDIETHADMRLDPKGRFVLDSDYDALLAERDALKKKYEAAKTLAIKLLELAALLDPIRAKDFADHLEHAMQGEQP